MHAYIGGIIRDLGGIPIEVGGIEDHVHILAKLPATIAIADALREIKSNSSKWAGERPDLVKVFAWQNGYAAFTVSKSQSPSVRKYIRNQEQHHRKKSFKEELLALLEKHEIDTTNGICGIERCDMTQRSSDDDRANSAVSKFATGHDQIRPARDKPR